MKMSEECSIKIETAIGSANKTVCLLTSRRNDRAKKRSEIEKNKEGGELLRVVYTACKLVRAAALAGWPSVRPFVRPSLRIPACYIRTYVGKASSFFTPCYELSLFLSVCLHVRFCLSVCLSARQSLAEKSWWYPYVRTYICVRTAAVVAYNWL